MLKPQPPPRFVSCSQYDGGTQSYGPVIFTPLGPVTSVGASLADEMNGLGQCSWRSTSIYVFSTSAGGGLSLPLSHTSALAWARNRLI